MTPKLVATDLDGTLLGSDGTVSAHTRRVLSELDARGVPVVFVTGRPIRWMEALWSEVGGHGLAICSNGGIVYDVATHSVRHARTIEPDVAARAADLLRQALPGTTFALEKTGGFAHEPAFGPSAAGVGVGPLEQILDGTVVKMLARHQAHRPEPFWRYAEEAVGDLVTTTWSSTLTLVEMSAKGVTKASTLQDLCRELDVLPEEVVAFGDMPNDIGLLSWAGTSYAMANAHPSVLATATHRAPSHDQDGVARVLSEIFDLG